MARQRKNSPYYQTEKQREELINKISDFSFEDPNQVPDASVILIGGKEGAGKTHLAMSISELEPVFFLDTENRGVKVVKKFIERDSTKKIGYKRTQTYQDIVVAAQSIIHNYEPPGTVIIDSGSDFQTFAEEDWKIVAKKEKVFPEVNWAYIYQRLDSVVYDIRDAGFSLVLTARLKKEYKKGNYTGNYIMRIYNRAPYNADLIIRLDKKDDEEPIKIKKENRAEPKKYGFDPKTEMKEILDKVKI